MTRLPLALLFALCACQSQETAVATACSAPVDCTDCMSAPVDQREAKLVAHIEQRVRNDETLTLLKEIAGLPPQDKGKRLREAAAEQGVSACPMADVFDSQAKAVQ